MLNPENIHVTKVIQTEHVFFMYLGMRVHACTLITTINVKRDCEFEREQEVYGRFGVREGEVKSSSIMTSKKTQLL